MAKYSKKPTVSEQTKQEAMKIAKGIQKPGQTKEQTKLIAAGIQKGIDQYKKQQKAKAREISKASKKPKMQGVELTEGLVGSDQASNKLPWFLLALSWTFFVVVIMVFRDL